MARPSVTTAASDSSDHGSAMGVSLGAGSRVGIVCVGMKRVDAGGGCRWWVQMVRMDKATCGRGRTRAACVECGWWCGLYTQVTHNWGQCVEQKRR